MRILVTGGGGFIGSHVVDMFIQAGHSVAIVDDLSTGAAQNLHPEARFYQVDIRSPELDRVFAVERPEVVSHQAARANVRESFVKPIEYADVNILGSLNLLECCRRYGTRKIIYASTGGAAYGEPRYLPVDEAHPIEPLDPYGASKHHVEHYLHLYQVNFGLAYSILRYPNVYGPRQNPRGEAGVIAIFIDRMLQHQPIVINGSGDQERDFVYVTDVAQANLLTLHAGDNGLYNLGSGLGASVNQLADKLEQAVGYSTRREHAPSKQGEVWRIFLNADKAQRELSWTPDVGLEDGLTRTVGYFLAAAKLGGPEMAWQHAEAKWS